MLPNDEESGDYRKINDKGKIKEGKKKDRNDGKMDKLDRKFKTKRILRVGERPTPSPSLECPEPPSYYSIGSGYETRTTVPSSSVLFSPSLTASNEYNGDSTDIKKKDKK
jgi:hypothetical protein